MKNLHRIIVLTTLLFWLYIFVGGIENATVDYLILISLPMLILTWRSYEILASLSEDELFDFFFLNKDWFKGDGMF